jgi:anthranilate phosphoribosyltransferase
MESEYHSMKNVIVFIAAMIITTSISYAQTDSSQAKSKTWQAGTADYQDYPTKDMRKLNPNEIPIHLRSTLQGQEYVGWEKGSVYFNSATNEYFYQAGSNSATGLNNAKSKNSSEKNIQSDKQNTWYRFDSKGRPLRDQRKPKN